MDQQVVIELLNLLGKTEVEFADRLVVKMSPHSYPQQVQKVSINNREVVVYVDSEANRYEVLPLPIKQTIGQRLRLMVAQIGF